LEGDGRSGRLLSTTASLSAACGKSPYGLGFAGVQVYTKCRISLVIADSADGIELQSKIMLPTYSPGLE
jgi:hypothetical protein